MSASCDGRDCEEKEDALRAQLAAVAKERDEYRGSLEKNIGLILAAIQQRDAARETADLRLSDMKALDHSLLCELKRSRELEGERDAALARVAKLEGMLNALTHDIRTDFDCIDDDAAENNDGHVDDCWVCYVEALRRDAGLDGKEG